MMNMINFCATIYSANMPITDAYIEYHKQFDIYSRLALTTRAVQVDLKLHKQHAQGHSICTPLRIIGQTACEIEIARAAINNKLLDRCKTHGKIRRPQAMSINVELSLNSSWTPTNTVQMMLLNFCVSTI